MDSDADMRAFDELAQHEHRSELVELARTVLGEAARTHRPKIAPETVAEGAAARRLLPEDVATAFGNVLDVLRRGPENDGERSLARALAAQAYASPAPQTQAEITRSADEMLWLAANTAFDPTGLLERALPSVAGSIWSTIADRIRQFDSGDASTVTRGELLVGAYLLGSSRSRLAADLASEVAVSVRDPGLARILRAHREEAAHGALRGELVHAPRNIVTSIAFGLTGISFAIHCARLVGRLALAYKKPAEVVLGPGGDIRVRWRVEMFGRTLGDHEVLVPPAQLARAARDVRYPRLALYAGLVALALGTYVGVGAIADGFRAASGSLIMLGLTIMVIGFILDFLLLSVVPGWRSQCRVLLVPRRGTVLCVGGIDIAGADALLVRLASR